MTRTAFIIFRVLVASLPTGAAASQDTAAARASLERALTLEQLGRLDEAIGAARRAIELTPASSGAYLNVGALYSLKGRQQDAIAAWRKAIALDPRSKAAHRNLGNAYTDAQQFDSAIVEHRRVLELDSADARGYVDLGTALDRKGLRDEALEQYRLAVARNTNLAMAWYDLGVTNYRVKRWPEAWQALIVASQLDESYPGLFETLQALANESAKAFQQRVKDSPTDALAHYYLAYAYSYRHDWGKAMQEVDRALNLDSARRDFIWAKGWFLSRQRRHSDALSVLRDCDSSDWACYWLVGWSHGHLGRAPQALDALSRAASINPEVVNVQQILGGWYADVGDNDKAAVALEKAIALGSADPRTRLILAIVYKRLGRYGLAWRYARIAERMGQPNARPLIEDLAKVSSEPSW